VFDGIKVHKPKYGIVIHRVPKIEIDLTQDHAAIISKLEEGNAHTQDIHITNITSLHRKVNTSLQSLHESIVIFTVDTHATNRCIHGGIYINYLLFPAERYSPQLNITQCFKCGDYGQRALHCKWKQKCGRCGDEKHATKECKSAEPTCLHCEGKHEVWHPECPERIRECRRMDELRKRSSTYYTT